MRAAAWLLRHLFLVQGLKWLMVICACWLTVHALIPSRSTITVSAAQEITSSQDFIDTPVQLTLSDMEAVWGRPLRQTLHDPKPKEVVTEKAPPPPPQIPLPRLLATFVERGQSRALFLDQKGSQRVRGETQSIEDCEIVAISPGAVELVRKGKPHRVTIADKKTEPEPRTQSRNKP
jgi:hypothetical protein